MTEPTDNPDPAARALARFATLTPSQRAVALAYAGGGCREQVARDLGCSPKTVDTHRMVALQKLGVENNAQLALLAVAAGLVDPLLLVA